MDYEKFTTQLLGLLSEKGFTDEQVDDVLASMDKINNGDFHDDEQNIPQEVFDYIDALKLEKKKQTTIDEYFSVLRLFFRTVNVGVEDVTPSIIRQYLNEYQDERGIKNSSLNQKRVILGCFFSWAKEEGYIGLDPCSKIRKIRFENIKLKPIPEFQIEEIKDACGTYRERTIIELFYSTGCRLEELTKIKLQDIDLDNMSIVLDGKGGKHRTVFISERCKVYLYKYINCERPETIYDELIVSIRNPHKGVGKDGIRKIFNQIQGRVGYAKLYKPHGMRRSFATNAFKRGMPLSDIQQLMGHSSPSVTMNNYINISDERLRDDCLRFIS